MLHRSDHVFTQPPEEGDIRSLFEQVLSLPQRHVRPTLRSRKSTFVDRESEAISLVRPDLTCEDCYDQE